VNADDVLDSYVTAVARRLPLRRRADVAYELRGLLAEELAERAFAAGREPDGELAVSMLREYGSPADAAVRYHRPFTIVPAGDTPYFVVAVLAGGAAVSLLGLSLLWFLAWIGALVLAYTARGLIQRNRPAAFAWRPRPLPDPDRASRVAGIATVAAWGALTALYLWPGPIVAALTGGRVGPADLAYSESFRDQWRMPWLVGLLAAVIVVHLIAVVRGRWTGGTRWARILVTASAAVQLGWHVSYGDVFARPATEDAAVPLIGLTSAAILAIVGVQLFREWARVRPAPQHSGSPATGPSLG
jgi:hypothetical protein